MQKYLVIAVILASVLCQQAQEPLPPVWANRWAQDFVETWNITNVNHRNVGIYQYDYINDATRLSRSNGQYDGPCKALKTGPANCEHLIVDGDRYIYYPETDDCCYCCGPESGCAALQPKWFIDPIFLGKTTYQGIEVFAWVIYEQPNQGAPNYYYETTEEDPIQRATVYIARQNYQQNYILESRRVDFETIRLPPSCKRNNLCPGTCSRIRPQQQF